MKQLSSYLNGRWQAGGGPGSDLYDPTTEEVVAQASTRGLDLKSALAYARDVGGPALRRMTFAERGALLAAMSKAIHAQREVLIEAGRRNAGNTRGDAKFDIDGATGTLMYYAGLGKELGDRHLLLDGEAVQIGRSNRLQGQHVLVSRPGAAIHINAFNFPAWGLAEKAACAILAGMPVVTKPATSTALMAWHLVKAVVDAAVLPDGVLSMVCGSAGDLLDHVRWSDAIAFTGGADTGTRIRGHRAVLAAGTPVNVEADSLNSVVLAPGADEETYDAFVRDVALEITQKAGQKCTATRRILVPADQLEDVVAHLGERLARVTVGNPALDEVGMGPLATADQLQSARDGIGRLLGQTRVAWGTPERGEVVGVPADKGWFVSPLLLLARDPFNAPLVHQLEVFGPVSTIMPYDGDPTDAARIVRLGDGSLVAAVYGDDRDFLHRAITELAGWHGRLVITDGKVADKAIGPGTVMPHLMHGGPGRAGGGEELGGTRGMRLYQQRCALQGNGPLLAKLLGA